MIGAQFWYYIVLVLTLIIAFIVYFAVSKKFSHFLYISFIGMYIIMLDYDLQVLGLYIQNHNALKFTAYIISTILFLYLGRKIALNEQKEETKQQKQKTTKKEKGNKNSKNNIKKRLKKNLK